MFLEQGATTHGHPFVFSLPHDLRRSKSGCCRGWERCGGGHDVVVEAEVTRSLFVFLSFLIFCAFSFSNFTLSFAQRKVTSLVISRILTDAVQWCRPGRHQAMAMTRDSDATVDFILGGRIGKCVLIPCPICTRTECNGLLRSDPSLPIAHAGIVENGRDR